jgi:hypothetical protein
MVSVHFSGCSGVLNSWKKRTDTIFCSFVRTFSILHGLFTTRRPPYRLFPGFLIFLHHFFQLLDLIASHGIGINHPDRDPFRATSVMLACFNEEEDAHELGMVP